MRPTSLPFVLVVSVVYYTAVSDTNANRPDNHERGND